MNPLLITLLLLALQPTPRTTLISRAVVGDQVIVAYDLASGPYPTIDAPGGVVHVQLVQDAQGWRGRVIATLGLCAGVLMVDGVTVTQQRCQWVPVIERP